MSQGNPQIAVSLLSGGLDSCVVAGYAKHVEGLKVHALVFDYGQRHRPELAAAGEVAEALGLDSLRVMQVHMPWLAETSLAGSAPIAKDRSADERQAGLSPEYVHGRNTVFLGLAASYAEALGAATILVGFNNQDHTGFPDCTPKYVDAWNEVLRLGTVARPVVKNPLGDVTKSAMLFRGIAFHAPFGKTWSCYAPFDLGSRLVHCGRCDACLNRREAFTDAGFDDPTFYAE